MNKLLNYFRYNLYSVQNKIFSSRTATTIVLLLLCNFIFAIPVLNFASDVGYKINIAILPFFLNSLNYMCAFVPIVIYYFSGVPFLQYSEMYCIIREGKNKWVIKHILHIIFMSFVFMFLLEIISIIPFLINGDFSNQWNEVVMTLSLTDKWIEYGTIEFVFGIIEKYTPYGAMLTIYFLVSLIISFLGVFMFTVSLLFSRIVAMCTGFLFEILVITAFNMRNYDNYLIYMSPFSWTDLTIFGKKYNGMEYPNGTPTMWWCVIILIVVMVIMSIVDIIRVNHMSFNYMNED